MRVITELDLDEARRRLAEAGAEAKRHEDQGRGWEANKAWERYLVIERAIAAQERKLALAARLDSPHE